MDRVRWGLLSTANINKKLIPVIRSSTRGKLTAVASRSADRASEYAAEWDIPRWFGSYEEMLTSGAIDAVYLSLPNHLHTEWTVRALEAGIHVLCEKPLALSVKEVDQITAASRRTGCHAAEAFMYRHHPQTRLIKEWIQEGKLGEIVQLRGVFDFYLGDNQRQPDNRNIRLIPEYGGGSLWDIGVYPLSMTQYLMGKPPVRVFGLAEWGTTGVDESFSGLLSFGPVRAAGPTALISCSFRSPFRTSFEISGTNGHLLIKRPFTNLDRRQEILHISKDGKHHQIKTPKKSLYLGEVEDFQSTILDGGTPLISLENSRDHVKTARGLYQSAREGRLIRL